MRLLILILLCSSFLQAQRDYSKVIIKPTKITDGIYMLQGSGGNIGLFTGPEATLMIDDQFAPLATKIEAVVDSLSNSDLKYLLNTHWHGDHTGGNEYFGNKGVTIVAHDNVYKRLSTDQTMKAFAREVKAAPTAAWPQITFEDGMKINLNGQRIELIHVHNAHTDGDSFVYFADANVLHMGDCFFKDRFPFIDLGSGGTVEGVISAIQAALLIADDETKIIPGHGNLGIREDLVSYHSTITTIVDRVKAQIAAGKTIEEIKSMNLTKDYDSWGTGFISGDKFVDTIWTDLNR